MSLDVARLCRSPQTQAATPVSTSFYTCPIYMMPPPYSRTVELLPRFGCRRASGMLRGRHHPESYLGHKTCSIAQTVENSGRVRAEGMIGTQLRSEEANARDILYRVFA
jgi:hypothetical protein